MSNRPARSVGCVVMAAGSSQRFGENKLAAVVGGKTLLERALEAVPTDLVSAVCVVTQYHQAEALARRFGFSCVRNEHPEQGISSTIRLGTQRLQRECQALMYLVCDQPLLRRESVAALVEFSQAHPDHIIGAAHGGVRGNPCIFPRRFYPELCALTGDVGGSAVIRRHSQALLLYELDGRELADVDTPQALAALEE